MVLKKDFFISYNKADRPWAEWIAWQIEDAGYSTILQAWDFKPGTNFVLEMNRATEETDRTLIVLSANYLKSNFTAPEWAAAFAQDPKGENRKLLPVRVQKCKPKGFLGLIVYIDLVGLDKSTARDNLLSEVRAVRSNRNKPTTPPQFPVELDEPVFPGESHRSLPIGTTSISPQRSLREFSRRKFLSVSAVAAVLIFGLVEVCRGFLWNSQSNHPTNVHHDPHTLYIYYGHKAEVLALAWSPDGKYVASGSRYPDNTVQIWNANNGQNIFIYYEHLNTVNTVAWSPDGLYIASGSGDRARHGVNLDTTVHVWNAKTHDEVYKYIGQSNSIHSLSWSPDSNYIASGSSDETLKVWEAHQGKFIFDLKDHIPHEPSIVLSVAWSPNGLYIASGDRGHIVHVWDIKKRVPVHTYLHHDEDVYAVAWSSDSRRIASGSADYTVQVWDATTGDNVLIYRGHEKVVNAVAWSPDGKYIASGGTDNTVQVWDASTGATVFTYHGHTSRVNAVMWSTDSKFIASASADYTVHMWRPM